MYNYRVRVPTFRNHDPLQTDWVDQCTRHEVTYGNLNIYALNEAEEEYVKASFPQGFWAGLTVQIHREFDAVDQNRPMLVAAGRGGGGINLNAH